MKLTILQQFSVYWQIPVIEILGSSDYCEGNLGTKDCFQYCENYRVELEEPVKEIRNMVHIWPRCKVESVLTVSTLQLGGFRKRCAASIWEDKGWFSESSNIWIGPWRIIRMQNGWEEHSRVLSVAPSGGKADSEYRELGIILHGCKPGCGKQSVRWWTVLRK